MFSGAASLRKGLAALVVDEEPRTLQPNAKLAVTCSGNWNRSPAAAKELYESEQDARAVLERHGGAIRDAHDDSLLEEMLGRTGEPVDPARMRPAIYALECAMSALPLAFDQAQRAEPASKKSRRPSTVSANAGSGEFLRMPGDARGIGREWCSGHLPRNGFWGPLGIFRMVEDTAYGAQGSKRCRATCPVFEQRSASRARVDDRGLVHLCGGTGVRERACARLFGAFRGRATAPGLGADWPIPTPTLQVRLVPATRQCEVL
ncbi:MAG: hypothetical protein OXI87_05440 [Albidovulum sp.]|nr:hypothetical protein [Albidovulum sp.]MDE0531599.1 hypothetical protein [Albidovulum sp.]